MNKKIISLILSLLMLTSILSPVSYAVSAASYAQSLRDKGFPESYIDDLVDLHKKYPKWTFEPFKTGLDWEESAESERAIHHSQQVIEKSSVSNENYFCSCSKCKKNGSYVIQLSPDWVCASEAGLKYYMDPRNWLDEKHIFQFESTKYNSKHTQSGVESIISRTWMYKSDITYYNTSGEKKTYKSSGNTVKYSKAIMNAAESSGMSAYYLASKIVQEVGSSDPKNAGGSCGTRQPFAGIYNYYNIGAYSNASMGLEWASGFLRTTTDTTMYADYDSSTKNAKGTKTKLKAEQYFSYCGTYGDYYKGKLYTKSGSSYTKDGKVGYISKSDVRTTYLSYGRPWTNPYRTIYNGAQYIADGYGKYQYTGYLQKFNVNKSSGSLYSHEYTTTINAPSQQSVMTYNAYKKADVLDDARTFYIPVFKNMPSNKFTVPTQSSSDESTTSAPVNSVKGLKVTSRTKETMALSWNKYAGATKYYLYIENKTKGSHFDKTVEGTSTTIKGLTPANEYSIKIRAYAAGKWTSYSSAIIRHALPPKASGLKLKSRAAGSVSLTWDKISGADGYNVYKYSPSSKKYTKLQSFTSNSGKVTSLKGGTKYELCVAAYTKDSQTKVGAKSKRITVTTKTEKAKLKSVTSPSKTNIKVTWGKASGSVSGYEIVWAKDSKFKKKCAEKSIAKSSATSYTGKNFTSGNSYYVRVRAYKTISGKKYYGAWSKAKSVKCK